MALMLTCIASFVAALAAVAAAPRQEQPTFSTRSDLVVIHAMVEDRRGAPVSGLEKANFLVYEDNYPQELQFFSTADTPATIGLLIDNSTSMSNKRELVVAAAVQFAELSNPDDEVFVLAFNEDVRDVWPARVLDESSLSVLRATLLNQISARGQTALYDAVAGGLARLEKGRHTRQVLVVVSDGSDNASAATKQQMLDAVRSAGAMVYTVALQDDVDRGGDRRLLKQLATETGGESFSPAKTAEVTDALAHIARDIRATYTLGYAPKNQNRNGTMRRLRVVARHPDGRPLKVQTRGGYLAPKPGAAPGEGLPHGHR
jgi:Ca-activated chloride channel family protein